VYPPLGAVSPHLDDLALSCATFLAAHPGSSMVTALAGGPAVVDPVTGWEAISGQFQPGADVVGARRAEDARAAAMLGCHVRHLDHWDHQYRNATYGYEGPTDRPGLVGALVTDLGCLVGSAALGTWMIPLGLSHPDHVIAASACLALVDEFPEVDWLVYEELPYAVQRPGAVGSAIADLGSLGFELRPTGIEVDPDPTVKRRVIDCYHSQVDPLGDGVDTAVNATERIHRLTRRATGRAR
jgi:LmbE family N-acetylglucosaminyl deacetylase